MLTKYLVSIFCFLTSVVAIGQEEFDLWKSGETPYSKENDLVEYEKEMWGTRCLFDITNPTLTIYPAMDKSAGKAVLIIPGGGYEMVAIQHEGHDIAKRLAENGITACVLKYRIPQPASSTDPHLVPLTDARKALSMLRAKADAFDFDPEKTGVMGFSAGSHLATVMGLWKSDKAEENPNFSCLVYGITDLSNENKKWLEESLYHRSLSDGEVEQNTLLNLVDAQTPPAFLVHAYDDDVCYVRETTMYADKLRENNIGIEMHLFETGGHGFGMGRRSDGTDQWMPLFMNWLKRL
ncbi:MAG: alpha/beta hydrolase [Ekhidna sp.]|nr:alpha/beta hydrolase [Ekhidna sp.]